MSNAQHTPGPWSLETVRTSSGICHKIGPFPGRRDNFPPRHACLYADYPSADNPADQEMAANARLIATAPELLEALQRLSAQCERLRLPGQLETDAEKTARAVIAKTTGGAA